MSTSVHNMAFYHLSFSSLSSVLFQHYTADLEGGTNKSERNKQLTSICLEALATAVHAVMTHFKDQLQSFLTNLGEYGLPLLASLLMYSIC